jgi:hypothetical protein
LAASPSVNLTQNSRALLSYLYFVVIVCCGEARLLTELRLVFSSISFPPVVFVVLVELSIRFVVFPCSVAEFKFELASFTFVLTLS